MITNEIVAPQQDLGKLADLNGDSLLTTETGEVRSISFQDIMFLGELFIQQEFTTPLKPTDALANLNFEIGVPVMGKIALPTKERGIVYFPVMAELQKSGELLINMVPLSLNTLKDADAIADKTQRLVLAATALVAPHLLGSLDTGIRTTECATADQPVSSIKTDHATPLGVVFESFNLDHQSKTGLWQTVQSTTGAGSTIKQVAHLHGQPDENRQKVVAQVGETGITGTKVITRKRSELPAKHVLFFQTTFNELGGKRVLSLPETLFPEETESTIDFAFIAAVLGLTAHVIGDPSREHIVQDTFSARYSDEPLGEVLKG